MIEESATVTDLEGEDAWVSASAAGGCHGCSAQAGCGSGVLARYLGGRPRRLRVNNSLGVRVGDEIVIGLRESAVVNGSVLVYLVPLVGLLAGAAALAGLASNLDLNTELAAIAGSAAGALLSVTLVNRRLARDSDAFRPIMLRRSPSGPSDAIADN